MSSGNPGRIRISPGFISATWALDDPNSMAAEQAPEVKNAAVGIPNFTKTSLLQLIMISTTAHKGRRVGSSTRADRNDSMD
jgi:hypothetical protein